jgi:hypothetical protein
MPGLDYTEEHHPAIPWTDSTNAGAFNAPVKRTPAYRGTSCSMTCTEHAELSVPSIDADGRPWRKQPANLASRRLTRQAIAYPSPLAQGLCRA